MGIWIRSQDKKSLINCTDIRVVSYKDSCKIWDYKVDEVLGTYETESRALEVLDEIQEKLTQNTEYTFESEIANYEKQSIKSHFVYQMPKE